MNIRISYKVRSLIYGVRSHSISQGKMKCDRCEDGGKQGASEKTQRGEIYMNKEHMEAGLERDKR